MDPPSCFELYANVMAAWEFVSNKPQVWPVALDYGRLAKPGKDFRAAYVDSLRFSFFVHLSIPMMRKQYTSRDETSLRSMFYFLK
jgi:hypothetical protein